MMRCFTRCFRAAVLAAGMFGAAFAASAQSRPASYAEFDTSIAPGDGAALRAAIVGGQRNYIYLQRGHYVLQNPVVIDRTTSLFVHGADRTQVALVARDPRQPLFIVRNAPLLNFAGLFLFPTETAADTLDAKAIVTTNTQPISLELQDCGVDRSMLVFSGPGTYRLQTCFFNPLGKVRTSVLVDHPGADVLVFGGDGSNGEEALRVDSDYAHLWQKRGRLRIYSTTFEGGLGDADVRIESASGLGAHVIANVRSEGVNSAGIAAGKISRLLLVPPTSERVDVLLKGNGGSWDTGPRTTRDARMNCKLVAYNGAGTVWLFGNRAEAQCGRNLVEGNAPQATIVSVGNLISSPQPFTVTGTRRIVSASDLYHRGYWTGDSSTNPVVRWIPDGTLLPKLASFTEVPQPPDDVLPPAIGRPVVGAALPGMIDVKSYGALGNGTSDDAAAIQRALDANCDGRTPKTLYFPAGTYRIASTLYLNHHSGGSCRTRRPPGGWIAGAGSSRTIIAMDPAAKRGVLASDGLAFATVQGITFKTWAWRTGDPQEPNVDLEMYPGYIATQQNNFYDVVFDGGYAAFATGVRLPTGAQCSSIVVFGGTFANARFGLVSGHYNALANGVYGGTFRDNDIALGSWTMDEVNLPPGGTFFAYRATSRGTRKQDFLPRGSANGSTFYFYEWDSDAPSYFSAKSTAAPWPLMFDRVQLAPRAGAPYLFDIGSSQGLFFLYSTLGRGLIRVGQSGMAQSYAVKMQSEIADWPAFVAPAPNGRLDELSWGAAAAPASLGAPGQPKLAP